MAIPTDNLRLFLTFLNELKQVRVCAVTNRIGPQLSIMGVVEDKDQLQHLLEAAEIDHYIVCSGDIITGSFEATAFEKTPKEIVAALDKAFHNATPVPKSLDVCSSTVNTDDGLKRIHDWFKAKSKVVTQPLKLIIYIVAFISLTGCSKSVPSQTVTVLLGGTNNINGKCVGHAERLCGPEREMLPTEIAGAFATEPDCQGIRLRGLTEQERQTPGNQLPLLLDVFYEGTHIGIHSESYMGNGKDESEGWMFTFNGPHGHFGAKARTESEMVSRVCKSAKGQGAEIDTSVGYTKPNL
jgi:hypothetical protein